MIGAVPNPPGISSESLREAVIVGALHPVFSLSVHSTPEFLGVKYSLATQLGLG